MLRTYAKPGDIVKCPLVRHPVVIKKIYSQDYYGPEKQDGWQMEFEDTDEEYRAWKQRCDGGKLIMLGEDDNPYKDYWTVKELQENIRDCIELKDEDQMQVWNDILDELLAAGEDYPGIEFVATVCNECGEVKIAYLDDILGEENWKCIDCVRESMDSMTEPDEMTELDPYRNYNAEVERHDRYNPCDEPGGACPFGAYNGMDCRNYCGVGVDGDVVYTDPDSIDTTVDGDISDEEYYDTTAQDLRDAALNMPCDNTGVCAGDGCYKYYECQVHHPDKDEE